MSSIVYGGSVVLKPEVEKENIDSMYEEGYVVLLDAPEDDETPWFGEVPF